ncbi:histidine kinase [Pedobacter jeongneungensis]
MTKKIFEWTKIQKIHLIGWSLFIFFEITLIGLAAGAFGKPINYLLHYILNIGLFYSNAHLVLKISFRTKKHAISRLIILMGLQIAGYILLRALLNYYLSDTTKSFNFPTIVENYRSFFQSLWRGLFFIGLSCFYYLFIEYKSERTLREEAENAKHIKRLRIREMENELSIAQYDYLRAQINPHLLFNTLSFLYDSIRKYNEDAGQAVLNLADLMRFSLEARESNEELPRLEEEIKQIFNLIELNKIRKDKEQFIDVVIPEDTKQFRFIPLVIITLLENMLKHGNLSRPEHPGLLELKLSYAEFSIHTRNLISTKIHHSGFNKGMENIEKRLRLAYGDNFTFYYEKRDAMYFYVKIELKL